MMDWPHAPPHRLADGGVFMVTAGTYGKVHRFGGKARLDDLEHLLLTTAAEFEWQMEAWAIFSNHYHFIAAAPGDDARSLRTLLRKVHSVSAKRVNQQDGTPGCKVWHNFLETHITTEKSHLARLHYVHANAVHHRLVLVPSDYAWCSAAWFERHSSAARVKTVYGFPADRLLASDDW
jgi:putative transposase